MVWGWRWSNEWGGGRDGSEKKESLGFPRMNDSEG